MQKEFEMHQKEKNMTDDEKKKFETERHEMEEKHKKHAPVSPNSMTDLVCEAVWHIE